MKLPPPEEITDVWRHTNGEWVPTTIWVCSGGKWLAYPGRAVAPEEIEQFNQPRPVVEKRTFWDWLASLFV